MRSGWVQSRGTALAYPQPRVRAASSYGTPRPTVSAPQGRGGLRRTPASSSTRFGRKRRTERASKHPRRGSFTCDSGRHPELAELQNLRKSLLAAPTPPSAHLLWVPLGFDTGRGARELVNGHALHLACKNANSCRDGKTTTALSLRARECVKNAGRTSVLPDRN